MHGITHPRWKFLCPARCCSPSSDYYPRRNLGLPLGTRAAMDIPGSMIRSAQRHCALPFGGTFGCFRSRARNSNSSDCFQRWLFLRFQAFVPLALPFPSPYRAHHSLTHSLTQTGPSPRRHPPCPPVFLLQATPLHSPLHCSFASRRRIPYSPPPPSLPFSTAPRSGRRLR